MAEEYPLYRYLSFKEEQPYRRYVQHESTKDTGKNNSSDDSNPSPPTHGSYGALLFHPNWKSKRKEILSRDMHRCVNCKSEKDLQVHHRQYHFIVRENRFRLPWDYPGNLLITLCEPCHNRGHNKYKVPTIHV
jgi:5-methylcytosine-specific restriction endonuclease McrA